MKTLSIGIGLLALLLVGSFLLTDKKQTTEATPVVEVAQEEVQKNYPTIRQEYTPPVRQEYAITPQVVTRDAVAATPSIDIKAPTVPVIPADMTPPQTEQPSSPAESQQRGVLVNYTEPSDLANLKGTNILFFKASWCITCTMLYDKLTEEKDQIPAGVTIWVVDYDSNESMRRTYGVTSQHTLVQIDQNRNKINLWRGGFSLAEVMSNVI